MDIHVNAKTTLKMRQVILRRAAAGWTYRQIAVALEISERTVAKWVARGRAGRPLSDGSSRPRRIARQLPPTTTAAIIALRRTRATAWQISAALRVPRSTVTRVLARVQLNRVALLEPAPVVTRYEWPHAGDLLHVDMKRLGRIRGIGHRIHGQRQTRARGVGYEWLHVAVDDATRLAHVEILAAEDGPTCAAFLRRAIRSFQRRGIKIRRLLTDNGMAYRARTFARACGAWAIRHRFTRPYRPQTNGKAERFIQTLLREWAYRLPYRSSARRTAALRPYLRFYNHQRPHASLGRRSPWMRFQEAA